MAAEVLLELLYYNGSGEFLTPEQTEMMNVNYDFKYLYFISLKLSLEGKFDHSL